jgi:hypothetical protein
VSGFRSKHPGYVDDAVREAVAANKRPKDILAGLRAGTLPGLEGRTVQIADRTFYRKLADARAKLRAGVKPKPDQPSVFARWAERKREARRLADEGHTAREILEEMHEGADVLAAWLRPHIPKEIPFLNTPEGKERYAEWLRRNGVVYWMLERLKDARTSAYHADRGDWSDRAAAADEAARVLAIETDNPEGRRAAAVACVLDARQFGIELDPADVGLSEFPPINFAGPVTGGQWDVIVEAIRSEPAGLAATNGTGP